MSQLDDEKLFYERFFALHRDPVLVKIVEHFGIGVFRRSSVLEGFSAFLEENDFRGDTCVEIGTCKGLTALVLARFFYSVVSIDIVSDPHQQEIADFAGARNIEFVTVRDNAEKAKIVSSLSFNAAYVDGDHARDTESDFALVRRCGRVLFHEYWPAQPKVMELVDGLRVDGRVVSKGKLALWTQS